MRRFRRSRYWPQAFIAICLPYLLASVLVDFVHVHRAPAGIPSASAGEIALTTTSQPAPRPDYSCTACLWLRTGLQLTPSAADSFSADVAASSFALLPDAVPPDLPIARSAFLRGPPSALLA